MVEMTGSIADFYQFHLQNLIKEPPNEWMCDTPSCNCIRVSVIIVLTSRNVQLLGI